MAVSNIASVLVISFVQLSIIASSTPRGFVPWPVHPPFLVPKINFKNSPFVSKFLACSCVCANVLFPCGVGFSINLIAFYVVMVGKHMFKHSLASCVVLLYDQKYRSSLVQKVFCRCMNKCSCVRHCLTLKTKYSGTFFMYTGNGLLPNL